MKYKNIFSIIIIFLVVLFNSVIYGALNTEMYIDGEAQVRVDRDIRITNLKVVEQTAGAYEKYSSSYSKNLTSMHVVLPNSNSTMTYEVDISNTGYAKYKVNDIVEEINSNNKIKYEIINLDQSTIIENGATYTFKIKFTTLENDVNTQGTFTLKYIFKMYVLTPLYNMVTENLKSLDTNLDFAESPTVETSGLFEIDSTKNDEYPVYYYRGIVGNNNVKFANICWKILRTTSTGGIKLIYNGIPKIDGSCNNLGVDTHISTGQFNSNNSTMEDVSYIYKDGRDSLIKTTIDNWYNDNLIDYTSKLEDTEWCSDNTYFNNVGSSGTIYTFFNADKRNRTLHSPSIICPEDNDKFTVSKENGNGLLTYPVGLLTADEATLAGHGTYSSLGYYLYTGQWFWTLSPAYFIGNNATVYSVHANGLLPDSSVKDIGGIRPSVSLNHNIMIEDGDGTVGNEYIVAN